MLLVIACKVPTNNTAEIQGQRSVGQKPSQAAAILRYFLFYPSDLQTQTMSERGVSLKFLGNVFYI